MKSLGKSLILIALGAASLTGSTSQAGVVVLGSSENGTIYDIDITTGLASNPRETGLNQLQGIAHSSAGVTYAWQTMGAGHPGNIYSIDLDTGAATFWRSVNWHNVTDMAIDPITQDIFVISHIGGTAGSKLVRLDDDTAATVCSYFLDPQVTSLAFNQAGALFMMNSSFIYDFDVVTHDIDAFELQPHLPGANFGTTFVPDGRLIGSYTPFNNENRLFSLPPHGSNVTFIGPTGLGNDPLFGISSMTVVPEPASVALLLLGLLAAAGHAGRLSRTSDYRIDQRTSNGSEGHLTALRGNTMS